MAGIFMYTVKASWWPPTYLTCFMSLVCNVILQLKIANTSNNNARMKCHKNDLRKTNKGGS